MVGCTDQASLDLTEIHPSLPPEHSLGLKASTTMPYSKQVLNDSKVHTLWRVGDMDGWMDMQSLFKYFAWKVNGKG